MYFEKPYPLVPGKKATKGYVLLRETLEKTGRARQEASGGEGPEGGMSLRPYRRRRRFDRTPEPSGRKGARSADPIFVVQLHHARSRHYDFRLQVGDTLKSWAVPKGPSLDPKTKRLAVEVEDHPLEYADFEGDIPKGEYGGGKVAIFDRGTWSTPASARSQLAKGHLHFELAGRRLRGAWDLVRTKRRRKQPEWLLIKKADAWARDAEADDLLEDAAADPPKRTGAPSSHGLAKLVALTHPERVVFPDRGFRKQDVADYYRAVMPWLLPEIRRRPLSLVRCPKTAGDACFFQKHYTPKLGEHVHAEKSSGLFVDDAEGVLELVQMNTLEFHPWGATVDAPDRADRLVFDLDPADDVAFDRVVAAARRVRKLLTRLSLESFVRVSGGKGLHVVVPLEPPSPWPTAKAFTHAVASTLAQEDPSAYVDTASKALRRGRIFVDYLRNTRGATSVASYSLRARAGAPVAMPVAWEELSRLENARPYDLRSAVARLARRKRDPWAGISALYQTLRQGDL